MRVKDLVLVGALAAAISLAGCGVRPIDVRWQERFAAFEEQDRENAPEHGGVLFVGSSSVSGWDIAESFPQLDAVNRGLPGATVADVVRHSERTVRPYRPGVVVLYGGDNDLAKGATPEEVVDAVTGTFALVRSLDPEAVLIVLSIKPSPLRWSDRDRIARTNGLLQRLAQRNPGMEFVDVSSVLLDEDGRPRAEYFHADGLHLTASGYRRWTELVAPYIARALDRRRVAPAPDRQARDATR